MAGVTGVGQFVPWDGGCLLIGAVSAVVPLHAHHAIQIGFGSEPGVRFRASDDEGWTEYAGAIIPSKLPHAMDATRVRYSAVLFVEPETREGRALSELYLRGGIAPMADEVYRAECADVFAVWLSGSGDELTTVAAWRVIRALTGGVEHSVVVDERILRAVAYVKSHLDEPLTLSRVAAAAFLSPSRFRHLFVQETGMGLRPYVLWRRFMRAWELIRSGESLSTAACAAGFADAAHLTRTSRRMFGLPPSALHVWIRPRPAERATGT
jgi:AraC-like DNA-binding protein